MSAAESNLLPSSIQRIRVFLIDSCGMKVKPWAGVDETLDALHSVMVAKRGCAIFWHGLRRLLATLADDLRKRHEGEGGTLIDNEVLDIAAYEALMKDIRAAVASGEHAGWKALTRALPVPAAALMALLAGVATVGCAGTPMQKPQDAAVETAPADAPPHIVLPDLGNIPSQKYDANLLDADFRCDGGGCTVEDVMNACGIEPGLQAGVTACLNSMRASWRENMGQALAARGCGPMGNTLDWFVSMTCQNSMVADSEFGGDICRPIPVYLGVRFA